MFKKMLVLALILGACLALYPVFDGHSVTMWRLNQVEVGMEESEVRRILGEPSTEKAQDWRYSGMTWCFVVIKFDDSGRVTLVDHDH